MALYVGLDVSLKTASICIIEADGTPVWEGKAESEPVPLVKALSRWWDRIALVGLEFRVLAESAGSVNLHSLGEAGEESPVRSPTHQTDLLKQCTQPGQHVGFAYHDELRTRTGQ